MGKEAMKAKLRDTILTDVVKYLEERYDTYVKAVGSGEYTMLVPDGEGNKVYANIKVSIPRGTRNGEGGYNAYDGYAVAKEYAHDMKEKTQKKVEAEIKKQEKIAADEKKRAEKRALAEANKNLKELQKIKITPTKE